MFGYLSSSQLAQVIQGAMIAVAALLVTAALFRVARRPRPRRVAWLVAWLACTAVLAALAIYLDARVGLTAAGDRLLNVAGAAVHTAMGLAVGAWWMRRPAWPSYGRAVAVTSLLAIEVLISAAALQLR